jgi:SAM-dependent methyltransferase
MGVESLYPALSEHLITELHALADESAVALLEAFLHAQPSAQPWQPVTDYSLTARRIAEGPHPHLIKEVFHPTRVMDAGCGPEGHLVTLLREVGVAAYGFDPLLDKRQARGYLYRGRITDRISDPFSDPFDSLVRCDLVICREVLEHVPLRELLPNVAGLVRRTNRFLYITTRFHQSPQHVLDVADHDDLDPTHITMLTKPLMRCLFLLHGCKSRPDLEARMDHRRLGRVLVFEVAGRL